MSKTKRQIALVCSMVLLGSVAAQAVSPMTQQEQLEQARLADEARSERLQRPGRVEIEGIPALETAMPPAPGGPSFYIRQIRLEGMEPEFLFLYEKVADYEHREMNLATINEVARSLNQMLLDRGYATSRVIIPEQKLEHGMLSLVVQPGRIHKFIYSKDSYDITWRTAFPCREGDILNVRQLEQGIEQMQGGILTDCINASSSRRESWYERYRAHRYTDEAVSRITFCRRFWSFQHWTLTVKR